MSADLNNMLRMMGLLGDDGFVNALTNVEKLVNDVEGTLERVEKIEEDAGEAVREANEALDEVDSRLAKVDETISRLEAKIEAGFTIGFFFFAFSRWTAGDPYLAVALFLMGLLGVSSLFVTIVTMPQVKRLKQVIKFALQQRKQARRERRKPDTDASGETNKNSDGTDDGTGSDSRTPRWETTDERTTNKRQSGR